VFVCVCVCVCVCGCYVYLCLLVFLSHPIGPGHFFLQNVKEMCHLPLAPWSLLSGNSSQSIYLDTTTVANLTSYLATIDLVEISTARFPPEYISLQVEQAILDSTTAFIRSILASETCTREQVAAFAWSVNPYMVVNINAAAADNINMTHAVMMSWKDTLLTTTEWNEMVIATTSSHMPSQDLIMFQYFGRLFNVRPSSGCGEHQAWEFYDTKVYNLGGSYPTEESIIETVGKHFIDGQMGADFFQDSHRLHHDALSTGGKIACDAIFGLDELPNPNPPVTEEDDDAEANMWRLIAIVLLVLCGATWAGMVGYWLSTLKSPASTDLLPTESTNSRGTRDASREMEIQLSPIAKQAEETQEALAC